MSDFKGDRKYFEAFSRTGNNSNNNDDHIERQDLFTVSSLCNELSPTRMLSGPGTIEFKSRTAHRAVIICNLCATW